MEQSQDLSRAQPDEILEFGKQEAFRHLSTFSEENVPPRPPLPVTYLPTARPKPQVLRKTRYFAVSVADWWGAAVAILRLWWLQFSSWTNRLWWRDVRGRCPDHGCHKKLIRAWQKPYGFPGRTCPQDHHFYLDRNPQ